MLSRRPSATTKNKALFGKSRCTRAESWIIAGFFATTCSVRATDAVSLGEASNFGVLGGSTVTNTGPSVITGNVGVSPGTSITGFPPGVVNGTMHAGDSLAAQAHAAGNLAYGQVAAQPVTLNLSGQDLGGLTLLPGVYRFDSAAQLTGVLKLNTGGDPNAVFHFQIGSTMISAANSSVVLMGLAGVSEQNIVWDVGSSATLGSDSAFLGTILANTSINLTTGASLLDGRAIALNGAVTLDTNAVAIPVAVPVGNIWSGNASNLWSGANWSPMQSGAVSGTLAPNADVVFSVTGVAPQNQNTILDGDATIASLTINDPAAVTISGAHLLTISGAGITISGGAGLATINSNLLLTGQTQAVTVNNSSGLVVNGVISGANGLTKAGVGQLTLGGANAYTGPTAVLQGTLRAAAANTIPSASAVSVSAGGVFDLNNLGQSVGSIAGSGGIKLGTALLKAGSDNTDTVYAGVISGPGSVQKLGTGVLALTGVNTYRGSTTVSAGTLEIDGSIAGSGLVSGGTLRGTGAIAGNLVNDAAVSPGTSGAPGALSIGGNFTQGSAGLLNIRLASPSSYSKLMIAGSAALGGTLNLSYLGGFKAKPGDAFEILAAAGGVSGKFSNFIDAHATGTILDLKPVYEKNDVLLRATQGSFANLPSGGGSSPGSGAPGGAGSGEHAPVNLTPNEQVVAKALDNLAVAQPGNRLVGVLDTLHISQLPGALSLLSPEDFASIFTTGLNISHIQVGNIERRLTEVRQGGAGFSDSGFSASDSRGAQYFDGKTVLAQEDKGGKEFIAPSAEHDYRCGFFISGTGEWGDLESTERARGSSFTTGGVTVGADYRVNQHLVIGAAVGYANTSSKLNSGGRLGVDSGRASLYATVYQGGFYVNAIAGAGYGSYDTRRRTVGGLASGNTDGTDFNALLGTGYDFHLGAFTVGPIASVEYATTGIDGFSEHGSLGALHIDSQSQDSLQSAVGLRAAYTKQVGRMKLTPEITAQWQHEYLTSSSSVDAGFSSGRSFTVQGPDIGRDALLLGAGVSVQLSSQIAIFAYYTGELGRANYTVHSVNGGVRVAF